MIEAHAKRKRIVAAWRLAAVIASSAIMAVAMADRSCAQLPGGAEPPSIEKVIIDANGRSEIEGLGRTGDVVELISSGTSIGQARVAENGRWRVVLADGLGAGTHQIRAEARSGTAGVAAMGDEVRVAIPAGSNGRAVVAYDGVTGDADRLTRQRAEELAVAAGQAYEAITTSSSKTADNQSTAEQQDAAGEGQKGELEGSGPLSIVIEWLKRSARVYREDVVGRLAEPRGEAAAEAGRETGEAKSAATETPVSVSQAAKEIEKERSEEEARRVQLAQADEARKAKEAQKAAEEAARIEVVKRKKAEDLARRKAEADQRIADELERLKKAKEEADRAKAAKEALAASAPPQKAKITLEPFTLPGQKPAAESGGSGVAALSSDVKARANVRRSERPRASGRCSEGRVTYRKGRRWYVTGSNDTLWDIAEHYYGTGLAYKRIYRANRKRLSSPHVVRPCLALRLPGRG